MPCLNSKTGTGIFEHKNDRAGLRQHDQESCYNTHSWSGVPPLAVIFVGLSLGLTGLTRTGPPVLCCHMCRCRVLGRKVVVSGTAALLSVTSPHGRKTVLEGLWWWRGTVVRAVLCNFLGIVPFCVLPFTSHLNCLLGSDG